MRISRLFWPQGLLDQWIVDEKISLEGERLTIIQENRTLVIEAATENEDVKRQILADLSKKLKG